MIPVPNKTPKLTFSTSVMRNLITLGKSNIRMNRSARHEKTPTTTCSQVEEEQRAIEEPPHASPFLGIQYTPAATMFVP